MSAFVTADGLFQYRVMPFGLKNVPATFQQMMNNVIHGLEGCDAYIDDLVLYLGGSQTIIEEVLWQAARCQPYSQPPHKSEFCRARVLFLGHIVGQGRYLQLHPKLMPLLISPHQWISVK